MLQSLCFLLFFSSLASAQYYGYPSPGYYPPAAVPPYYGAPAAAYPYPAGGYAPMYPYPSPSPYYGGYTGYRPAPAAPAWGAPDDGYRTMPLRNPQPAYSGYSNQAFSAGKVQADDAKGK
ncbi:hypothetical protein QR680_016834 [Steinernema hermaphroditum]|uniref:Uncharacterized protein n=1 Tax=Steinernema hermaphroditum TaxID=289476 RepID=A0AA39HCF3_9BILA|nr:hypothetical protein QR680_016834 [Steinernema hermaphroditum]